MTSTISRPVWAELAGPEHAEGLEQIYEGFLLHYGHPQRDPSTGSDALLGGDEQYAQGLARIAELDDPEAIAVLAELIGLASRGRAEHGAETDDFALWAATARFLSDRSGREVYRTALLALRDDDDGAPLEGLVADLELGRERRSHRVLAGAR
jgi:hypothetical protein